MRLDFCVACGERDLSTLEHHHLVPLSVGGPDVEVNLVTLCHVCHGKAHGSARSDIRSLTPKALTTAKARGVKLGGIRPGVEMTAETRAKGRAAKVAQARARAADLAPTLAALQAEGVTTLAALAHALTERGIPTAWGASTWSPMQVSRVLKGSPDAAG